jgi:putative ABC transport system permease protein
MSVARLALAYALRRPFATLLIVLLLALGVAVAILALLVARELEARLTRDSAGIDLVVGAKGSPLQLVLAGVYHVDVPPGNIPLGALAELRAHPLVAAAIPLSLGDSFAGFRIVGTEPALIDLYRGRLAHGSLWSEPMQAVLGSDVARRTNVAVGATFAGVHGLTEGGGEHAAAAYRVVGVLAPSGTVLDRMVLTSIDSVWAVHDAHHAREEHEEHAAGEGDDESREITMVLVRYASPLAAASLPRRINSETGYVAASPAYETARLLSIFGVGLDVLRAFAYLLIGASALMLFVALVQALEERRYDLAILRALGAHRLQVAAVLLIESSALAATGALLGWLLGHALAALAGVVFPVAAPIASAAWRFAPGEAWIVALAILAGILAAAGPARRAYRLDVAATLADT